MLFDINGYMRVKLTDTGRRILEDEHDYYEAMRPKDKRKAFELRVDSDGWYRAQAWALFKAFGPHFGPHIQMGAETPFETEIDIEC